MSVFASSLETSLTDAVPASKYASDCFVTSEAGYNDVLVRRVPSGEETTGAYVGVGPDQNFIYAGVLRPVPEPRTARLLATHLHVQPGDLIQAPRLSGETRLGTAILAADDRVALAEAIAAVRAGTEVVCSRDA